MKTYDLGQADLTVVTTLSAKGYGTSVIEDCKAFEKALQRKIKEIMLQDAEKALRCELEKLEEEEPSWKEGPVEPPRHVLQSFV